MIEKGSRYLTFEGHQYNTAASGMPPIFHIGWFLLQFLISFPSKDQIALEKRLNLSFSYKNCIQKGWYMVYMNESQYKIVKNIDKIKIFDPKSFRKPKRQSNSDNLYVIKANPDWKPKNNFSKILEIVSDTVFIVSNISYDDITNDPTIQRSKIGGKRVWYNRFVGGQLQDGESTMVIQDNQVISNRYLQSIGIDGSGQIITVIDSGLDIGHCFFRDPNNEYNTILGRTNLNHRKVVRYDTFSDFTDNVNGHGTHVSGTIAGESVEPNRLIAAYNGVAPKSKIYFIDIGLTSQSSSELSGKVNYNYVFSQMNALNSLIQSNSWGYDVKSPDITEAFDQFAFYTQMLIVFANGNENYRNSIFSPSDGKNILSVAFSTKPYTSDIELGKYFAKIIFDDNVQRKVIKSYMLGTADPPIINTEMQFCDTDAKDCTYETGKVMVSPVAPSVSLSYPFVQISQADYDVAKTKTSCSILLLPSTAPRGFQRHEYSSRGTTLLGTLKPDIIAPGTNTISSRGSGRLPNNIGECSINTLIRLNGSSMATPAVSGLAGLIQNYFKDGWYPKMSKNSSTGFLVASHVVRSILINSAKSINNDEVPNYEQGFGMPDLREGLGFGNVGVRFFQTKLNPNSRKKFQIKTTRVANFSATISYNDYPYGEENGFILVVDVDLIVRDPNGKIYNGNNVPGEFTSTNEKVFIKNAPVGTYFIDLINPSSSSSSFSVNVGLTISGGFETTDDVTNPTQGVVLANNECINSCGRGKCSNGLCICDENHTGVYCQREINKINTNENITIKLTPRFAYYFKFNYDESNIDPSVKILSSIPASVRVCLDNQSHNAMYEWSICNTLESSGDKNISISKSSGKTIFGVMYPIYDIPFSITYIAGNPNGVKNKGIDDSLKTALIVACSCLAVILVVILIVYLVLRFRKSDSRVKHVEDSYSSSSNSGSRTH